MYYISIVILSLGLFVQNGYCTNCTIDQLGTGVPKSACKNEHCKSVTLDELNAIKDKEVLATEWNFARELLVSPCKVRYNFNANSSDMVMLYMTLNITINYGENCDQVTYYDMRFVSNSETEGKWERFIARIDNPLSTNETDAYTYWELCFPYLQGSDFIYRRCKMYPLPPSKSEIATIYVYEEAGKPNGGSDIIKAAEALGVTWANKTVDCL